MIIVYLLLLTFLLLIFVAFTVFIIAELVAEFTTDAPFVPIPKEIEDDVVEALELKPDSILYDLGCGDARILLKAVKKHPTIKAVGIEVAFVPYLLAKLKTRKHENIIIKRENIFKTDISGATHIFMYLYPKVINKLIGTIKNQCSPNTVLVTCDFEITSISPIKIIELEKTSHPRGKKLFVYNI